MPKWLQRRHNLWDQELVLLNGTAIRYAQLMIPCCESCNSIHLSGLENQIRSAIEKGYEEAVKLPALRVYQWIGKIFYGILRKEVVLLLDRRAADKGTIVPPELIQGFSTLHLFLQSIRKPFVFQDCEPFSVLVVNLHFREGKDEFYFRDSLHGMVCSLRTRGVGFIVALQDAGVIPGSYGRYVEDVAGRKLLPIQFDELYAKCLYQMCLFTRVPKFLIAAGADEAAPTTVHMLPVVGLSTKPVVADWVQADYAQFLFGVLSQSERNLDPSEVFVPADRVMTWMSDEHGRLILADVDGSRIPAESPPDPE
jgi:hypothetical protein